MKLWIFTFLALSILCSTCFAEGTAAKDGEANFSSSAPPQDWPAADNFSNDPRKATLDVVDSVLTERQPAAEATQKSAR